MYLDISPLFYFIMFCIHSEPVTMVTEAERKPSEADLYEFQSEDEDGHKMQPGKISYIYWLT